MEGTETQVIELLSRYGYGAAPVAILLDPAGIPWAWVFLMLLAQEADKSVLAMLLLGFASLFLVDMTMYALGYRWGAGLLDWAGARRPGWKEPLERARLQVCQRGALAVVFGRYLPFVGRWMGLGAGMARMAPLPYTLYAFAGAFLSAFGFGVPAHLLGRQIIGHPLLVHLVLLGTLLGVLGAVFALVLGAWKHKRKQASDASAKGT